MTLILTLTLIAMAYLAGTLNQQTITLAKRLADWLSDLAIRLTPDLPETETLPLYADWTPSAADARFWKARAGYYLVRTANGYKSQWLTGFSLWLRDAESGPNDAPIPLSRTTIRSAYTAFTPNGRPYTRARTERTWHISLELPEVVPAMFWTMETRPEVLERTVAA